MTVTVKNKTPLVVPPSVRRQAGLKSGQEIEFKVSGGVISFHPKLSRPMKHRTNGRSAIPRSVRRSGVAIRNFSLAIPALSMSFLLRVHGSLPAPIPEHDASFRR